MNTRRYGSEVLVFIIIMSGCGPKQDNNQPSSQAVVAVKAAEIILGNIDVVVTATGKTEALRTIKVFSPVAGRIISMKVLAGTYVNPGDVLATIQTKESYAAVSGAEVLVHSATTPQEKEDARRALELARSTRSIVTVRSRFGGVVSVRNVSEGELVAENVELLTLLDLSTLVFAADVMLRDLPAIHAGQSAIVRFPSLPDIQFKASVDAINPQSNLQSQTIQARLRFVESPAKLKMVKVDMAGAASIVVSTHKNILVVPRAALLRNDETGSNTIVVLGTDSLSKTISVQVGAVSDSMVEISAPDLRPGLKIVTEGNYALGDSVKLKVVDRER